MKANNYISKKEHKLLLIFAFILFILAFTNFVCDSIESYNKRFQEEQIELKEKANNNGNSFGIYGDWGANRPWYRFSFIFLTLLAFLTLQKIRVFIFPLFITIVPFSIFAYWFIRTYNLIVIDEFVSRHKGLDRTLIIATVFDYLIFFFVSILLFWQISILLRMLIKTLQRKSILP